MTWVDAVTEGVRSGVIRVGRGASEDSIATAERLLGYLPRDYRRFIAEFGYATIRSNEMYGLGDDLAPYLDVVKVSLAERQESPGFPAYGIVIMNDGGGNLYYLDGQRGDADSPVYVWYHDDPDDVENVSPDFGSWVVSMMD
jgi:hypothetical protein